MMHILLGWFQAWATAYLRGRTLTSENSHVTNPESNFNFLTSGLHFILYFCSVTDRLWEKKVLMISSLSILREREYRSVFSIKCQRSLWEILWQVYIPWAVFLQKSITEFSNGLGHLWHKYNLKFLHWNFFFTTSASSCV